MLTCHRITVLIAVKGKFLHSARLLKALYAFLPSRPVQLDTISTYLGSIQQYAKINAQRLLVHISSISFDSQLSLRARHQNVVIFDTKMSMVSHVKYVCCISYYHLRNIASIRSCLTQKAAVRLEYSLVISKID